MIQPESTIGSIRGVSHLGSARVASESALTREGIVLMTLCLLVALTPLVFAARLFEPYIAAKEILVQAGTATAALLWLLSSRAKSWTLPLTPIWVPLFALALIGAASVLWSTNPSLSFEKVQYLATYVLLFAIALSALRNAQARSTLATALVLAGSIEAVYVLLQYSFGDPLFAAGQLQGKWQTFGTLGNPNWTGEFLAVAALVSLGLLIDLRSTAKSDPASQPLPRHLTLAALILMSLALAATLARGAWLAFIIGAIAFLMIRRFSDAPFRLKSVRLPLAATAIAAAVVIVIPLVTNRAALDHLFNLKSISGRILMWRVTGTMIGDAPWLGHGLGTFGLQFPNYQAEALAQPWAAPYIANASFTSYAHNDYLQLWAELGIFGLLAFGALVWLIVRRGRVLAGDPVALGCWAAVISLLVNAAVAFPLHLPTTLMLFVVLVAVVECAAYKRSVGLSNSPFIVRIGLIVLTLTLCISAYLSSYDRFVSESALWRANAALSDAECDRTELRADARTAILHAPTRLDGYVMLGQSHIERGEYPQALLALNRAQALGFDPQIFDLKARALDAVGEPAAATATLDEIIRLRPDLDWPRVRRSALTTADEPVGEIQ